jgi:guanylate kinase
VSQEFQIRDSIWNYGITKEAYENSQLFIMTPYELSKLPEEINKNCFKVFLKIDEDVRRSRITKRNDRSDSVERRIVSDRKDFENFTDYDLRISDPDFEAQWVYDLMKF